MKKIICIVIAFILVILTGCTSDLKVNEDVVKDISDKITETIIEKVDNERVEKKETHTLDAANSIELIVNGQVGDINIIAVETQEAIIDATIIATSNTKSGAKKLLEDFTYIVEEKWNAIKINTTQSNDKSNIISDGIKVDLNIKIPKTIKNITITTNVSNLTIENINCDFDAAVNVGDINIRNSNSLYNVKTDVGDIKLVNCIISGNSNFNTSTGNVDILADDISDAKNINVETHVGNISMSLPESSSYKANIIEFMKEQRTEINGDGKADIKLIAHVGDINLE